MAGMGSEFGRVHPRRPCLLPSAAARLSLLYFLQTFGVFDNRARLCVSRPEPMPGVHNLRDYLLIREAASFLGVSEATLRNWHRVGKIAARRNPINGYRLFKRADLEAFLKRIARPTTTGRRPRAVL